MEYYYQILDSSGEVLFDSMDKENGTFVSKEAAYNRAKRHMDDADSIEEGHQIKVLEWDVNSLIS